MDCSICSDGDIGVEEVSIVCDGIYDIFVAFVVDVVHVMLVVFAISIIDDEFFPGTVGKIAASPPTHRYTDTYTFTLSVNVTNTK